MPLRVGGAKNSAGSLKLQERNSVSLELQFSRKNPNGLQRMISSFDWDPNAYATGFFVGDGLLITAYHVVSGNLEASKRIALGFDRKEKLKVTVRANGCLAKVIKVDEEADLALLQVCGLSGEANFPAFQSTVTKDEELLIIARPHGQKVVGRGTFFGSYSFNGIEYWSGRVEGRDGFSGSPVYNQRGELVGVFSGYDWSQKLAVISPGARAQRLMGAVASTPNP